MFYGYLPMILDGLRVTLSVASVSLAVACVFGMLGALAKLSGSPVLRGTASVYTTVVRSLPDLLLMLLVFYGGQILLNRIADAQGWGYIDIDAFAAGTLTLGFVFGAYLTETFRGAILAIPRGQLEAGHACGLSGGQVHPPHPAAADGAPRDPGLHQQLAGDAQGDRARLDHRAR